MSRVVLRREVDWLRCGRASLGSVTGRGNGDEDGQRTRASRGGRLAVMFGCRRSNVKH